MATNAVHSLYPTFLKLAGRRVLLVGAGNIATAKLGPLLAAGADVTVVAPAVDDRIAAAAELAPITVRRRAFTPTDLDDVWFVVAASTAAVNAEVANAAEARRVLVLAVDDVDNATAYGAGTLRRGGVTIAVSTEGRAPALAGLLREGLEALVPEEIGDWVETARALRAGWRREGVPHVRRRPLLLAALNQLYVGRLPGDESLAAARAAEPELTLAAGVR